MILIEERKPNKIPGLTSLFVKFNYNQEVVSLIKECLPVNYDKKTHTWEIPITRLAKFVNQVSKYDEVELHLLKEQICTPKESVELSQYKTKLYDYQKEGIQYGLNHDKWILLDSPGLGKSIQCIYLASELKKRNNIQHCLIICGINTLKTNWEKEIKKHSDLSCTILGKKVTSTGRVHYGSVADRLNQLKSPIEEFFVITNVETLRSKEITKELQSGINKFDMIVVDEAHKCKEPTAQQTQNLLKLTNAQYKVALTGTVILNSPLDVFVPLKWTENDHSTYTNFKQQYCQFGGYFSNEIVGYKNLDYLKAQLDTCSLRRTKELLDLPPKNIIDEVLDMTSEQQLFYDNIVNGIVEQVNKVKLTMTNLLAMTTRLRQATVCPSILTTDNIPSAKINRCCELVEEITSNANKVVVFSAFKEPLNQLNELLKKYNPLLCTGDVPDSIISNNIDEFQNNDINKVILCTHSKMGTGVTLTAASYAIFLDLCWTAGLTEQCEDRIHRIGSKNPVFIYRLHCNDTFDLRVKEIVENKEAIGNYIVDNIQDTKTMDVLKRLLLDLKTN